MAPLSPPARLKQAGIIAVLRGAFSLTEIIEIGDALLAAPILALEIDLKGRHALPAMADLRQRAGPYMLIGAGAVDTVAQGQAALAAGAQFIAAPSFAPAVMAWSQATPCFYLPGVTSLAEARRAAAAGCRLMKLPLPPALGPAPLLAYRAALREVEFIAAGEITPDHMAAYAQAGVVAVAVDRPLITEPYLSMAALITTARALQKAWVEAQER